MTYRELLEKLQKLGEDKLDRDLYLWSDGIYYDRVNVKFDNAGDLIIIFKE
jgi:hypothetical protein